MRNIFKPASVDPAEWRARVAVVVCTLLCAAMAAAGISHAIAAKASPADHVVKIENMKFSPAVLTLRVGDRIAFRNDDLVPHTATASSAGAFDSGLVKPGESWLFIAKSAGKFGYTCTFHPMMAGEIRVEGREQ
jgi:plastocyanin